MKWWYKDGNFSEEKYDSFEDVAFEIASMRKNHLYEHDINNIYIFNETGLFLVIKASEIDPLSSVAHNWTESQKEYSLRHEFSRIKEDRMLYLTKVLYEKEWKTEEEEKEILDMINNISNYSELSNIENKMPIKEYKCVFDAGRNVSLKLDNIRLVKERKFTNMRSVSMFMRNEYELQNEMEEHSYILAFDSAMNLIGITLLSKGNDSECEIDTKIVFRFLILVGAIQFIVVHNHPNGIEELSQRDFDITFQLKESADLLNIKFIEHVIISNDKDIYALETITKMLDDDSHNIEDYMA